MMFLRRFLGNHVLANLSFGLVILLGVAAYMNMPRSRDPDINFNWLVVTTTLPGASSIDVEKRITDPLEDQISTTMKDLRFVSSTSRDGISSILVRFEQMSAADFDKRLADLRREVQNVYNSQLPPEASDPFVLEITSSSGFPTAMIALTSEAFDDNFRRYVTETKKELERLGGVDQARVEGVENPELHVAFYPDRLEGLGVTPADLADTMRAYFKDVSIGDMYSEGREWSVRLEGTSGSLEDIESFPIVGASGVVPLGEIADVYRSMAEPSRLVRYQGKPAVMISLTKQEGSNILDILEDVQNFIVQQNSDYVSLGYKMELIDDQTISTREAIGLMQDNATIGLFFVVLVSFLFLGGHISFLTTIGIPFTLAGTFFVISLLGMSVNNMVLLGVVIALGMLVDDAVVVVESIYYRLQRGMAPMDAGIDALQEVFAPVLTSVMTTIAVFLPLMLLPGVLGEYMRVIPIVVCVALLISLFEAFWILPVHIAALKVDLRPAKESKLQRKRRLFTKKVRHYYSLLLIKAMRYPLMAFSGLILGCALALVLLMSGVIKFNFFASDPLRVIYANADLPRGSTLEQSVDIALQMEQKALAELKPEEVRSSIVYSGQQFTNTESLVGNHLSQVMISLAPDEAGMRSVVEIVADLEKALGTSLGVAKTSVIMLEDGPPAGSPVNMKLRGNNFEDIQRAVDELLAFMATKDIYRNTTIDFKPGNPEMRLALNGDAIKRAGLKPSVVTRSLQSYVDGELVSQYQYLAEEVDVRLLPFTQVSNVESLLEQTIVDAGGQSIALRELVDVEYGQGYQNIRHYNFKRAVTIESDVDETQANTVEANDILNEHWQKIRSKHPGVDVDYSGELDDIQESMDGMLALFIMGMGLIYLILGAQFKSYTQPLLVLLCVPLAFVGVVFGLAITSKPMSLMTMYGVVALSGISVNSAIVLISAANSRMQAGMGALHATIFAARRRVIPIMITSLTTIAGLFSLAAGIAGKSLIWGSIATAIVSGLLFSTGLILITIPLIYRAFAARYERRNAVEPR